MKEIYIALAGAVSRETQLALVAGNLANVNSVGFKKDDAIFRVRRPEPDLARTERSASAGLGLPPVRQQLESGRTSVTVAESRTDFSPGALRDTGNAFDLALESRGQGGGVPFFVVATPQGDRLTRMGNFQINSRNELVTPDGYAVRSQDGGVLQLQGRPEEPIQLSPAGAIVSAGRTVGSVRVAVVDRPEQLDKQGSGLWNDRGGQVASRPPTPADGVSVRNRCLEMSNVNAVEELVKMIELQRSYTAFQKSMQTLDDASSKMIATASNR